MRHRFRGQRDLAPREGSLVRGPRDPAPRHRPRARGPREGRPLSVVLAMAVVAVAAGCIGGPSSSGGSSSSGGPTGQASSIPTVDAAWTLLRLSPMTTPRAAHTATVLPDGRVLLAGGFGFGEGAELATTELYDPATRAFTPGPAMTAKRLGHSASRLADGRVLIAGGYTTGGTVLDTAELSDPITETFRATGRMTEPRGDQVAVPLLDGRVLLVGGAGPDFRFLASAEVYDPATGTFSPTGGMAVPREGQTTTRLADGRVLVTGGHTGRHAQRVIHDSAEIFDPTSNSFGETGSMTIPRHKHDAVALSDGRVLVLGGADARDDAGLYASTEVFDPATGRFAPTGSLEQARYKFTGTSILLPSGDVLVAGGALRPEVYTPDSGTFAALDGSFGRAPLLATATLLGDGSVLVAGGYSLTGPASDDAWLIEP